MIADCSKIRTHWKFVIIFYHPGRTWWWSDVRETAPQFCGPKFIDTGAMAGPIVGDQFGRSTTRRRGGRRPPPREDPARASRSSTLFNPGSTPVPHHVILDCKIAARLFRAARSELNRGLCQILYVPQWVLPLRRPHNHQLRTAIVSANWRGCEGEDACTSDA